MLEVISSESINTSLNRLLMKRGSIPLDKVFMRSHGILEEEGKLELPYNKIFLTLTNVLKEQERLFKGGVPIHSPIPPKNSFELPLEGVDVDEVKEFLKRFDKFISADFSPKGVFLSDKGISRSGYLGGCSSLILNSILSGGNFDHTHSSWKFTVSWEEESFFKVFGFRIPLEKLLDLIHSSGFGVDTSSGTGVKILVPFYRTDVCFPEEALLRVGELYLATRGEEIFRTNPPLKPLAPLETELINSAFSCGFRSFRARKTFATGSEGRILNPSSSGREFYSMDLLECLPQSFIESLGDKNIGKRVFDYDYIEEGIVLCLCSTEEMDSEGFSKFLRRAQRLAGEDFQYQGGVELGRIDFSSSLYKGSLQCKKFVDSKFGQINLSLLTISFQSPIGWG